MTAACASAIKPVAKVRKDPQAILDYSLDWGTEWLEDGDTITASAWTADPADDLTVDDQPYTATVTTVWLSGGLAGSAYVVTNHITTALGREDDRSLLVEVVER